MYTVYAADGSTVHCTVYKSTVQYEYSERWEVTLYFWCIYIHYTFFLLSSNLKYMFMFFYSFNLILHKLRL